MAKHSQAPNVDWGRRIIAAVVLLVVGLAAWGTVSLLRGDGAATQAGDSPTSPAQVAGGPTDDDADAATDGADATGDGDAATTGPDDDGADGTQDGGADDEAGTQVAAPVEGECGLATVWVAPEIAEAVGSAADRLGDDCYEYAVVPRGSAAAQSALRAGEAPDVWIPGSSAWPALVGGSDVELEIGDPVASSPVLLAGAPQVVAALGELGVGEDTSFPELLQTYQGLAASGDAPVAMRVGDPRTDPATMALLSDPGALGEEEPDAETRRLLVMLAQTAVQGQPLSALAADPATIVPATEQQVELAAAEGTELAGIELAGGSGTVQLPFVRVGRPEADGSVNALEQELSTGQTEEELRALGLRPGGEAQEAAAPEAAVGIARVWTAIAPQSRILALIDISGSMREEVADGVTRIDLTRQAVQGALQVLPGQTAIGLWYFSTHLDGEGVDHREVVPLRALNEQLRPDVTQRDALLAESENLDGALLTGDTGLHDALWAAYQQMQQDQDPATVASVLLLTDGVNDDPEGGLDEDEVVDLLTEARESGERPVTVVLLGMGPEVDEEALQRLAEAAGGESRVIRDPRELPQVFIDVVAQRAQ